MVSQGSLFGGDGEELGGGGAARGPETLGGVEIHRGALDADAQTALVDALSAVVAAAPLVRPITPWGQPMRVAMTAAGALGWVTDRGGYRYEDRHPITGDRWPAIPDQLLAIWRRHAPTGAPDCDSCLINHYFDGGRMGLHQDKDEAEFEWPVVSVSLGDPCVFRVGGLDRKDPTRSTRLRSGDVAVMGGAARLAHHGVDRILIGESDLLTRAPAFGGGRVNVTLRRAAPTA